jgi:hypothetical protein
VLKTRVKAVVISCCSEKGCSPASAISLQVSFGQGGLKWHVGIPWFGNISVVGGKVLCHHPESDESTRVSTGVAMGYELQLSTESGS